MSSTTFVDRVTPINASWLNDVNTMTYKNVLNVKMAPFNAVGDGTTDDTSAINAAIAATQAINGALIFPAGTYKVTSTIDFLGTGGLVDLTFLALGKVVIYNTGSGPVASLDAGPTSRCDNITFKDFILKGNASSTYGLYMRGLMRSDIRSRALDVATAGFKLDWAVTSNFHLTVSDNIDTFTVNPAIGLILDVNDNTEYVANCKFHVVMEGPISGTGVDMIYGGLGNIFTGTCEGISRGFRQRSTAGDCILHGMDFEQNTEYDVLIEGRGLTMDGCNSTSPTSSVTVGLAATASDASFRGGFLRQIDIDASATGTTINDVSTSDGVLLGITGTGSANWRGTGNVEMDTSRVITALIPDQLGDTGLYTATLTGCTTSPTSTIDYRRIGDMVLLNIPSITAVSNTTACTITGMPTAIRPSATRSDVGTVTDNSVNALGRFEVGTDGVITLRVAAGTAFTNSGTKGVQASTISYKV